MKEEVWKPVKGFESYEVSSLGRVRSIDRVVGTRKLKGKMLSPFDNGRSGYLEVILSVDGKRFPRLIHRLVAKAFLPNPNNHRQVNHIDEDKRNNVVSNLEWCDALYNNNYGSAIERSRKKKSFKVGKFEKDSDLLLEVFDSTHDVERKTGYKQPSIYRCCNGKQNTAYGFKWRYIKKEVDESENS